MTTLRLWALALLLSLVLAAPSPAGVVAGELIYRARFETGPAGWTTESFGFFARDTEWQLGAPSNVGPPTAFGGLNAFGTNIDSNYSVDANARLLSPVLDLRSLPDATLRYAQFRDIEQVFDGGRVSILDASSGLELVVLATAVDRASNDWEQVSHQLPASVLGEQIQVEFRFQSDNFNSVPHAGWYIDDVEIRSSVPEPAASGLLVLSGLLLLRRRQR